MTATTPREMSGAPGFTEGAMLRLDQFDAVLLDLTRARTRHQLATSKLRTFAMSLAR
jgi:hypothetical protein